VEFLIGTWSGSGAGEYPTIDPFDYVESISFGHVGKPFLAYSQRTRSTSEPSLPLHAESGYWRFPSPDRVEVVVAHPTGLVEVDEGTIDVVDDQTRIELVSSAVVGTATAKEVTAITRRFVIDGDVLTYEVAMAAVGQPLQHHLAATLRRE
jgi:hypothetical protein